MVGLEDRVHGRVKKLLVVHRKRFQFPLDRDIVVAILHLFNAQRTHKYLGVFNGYEGPTVSCLLSAVKVKNSYSRIETRSDVVIPSHPLSTHEIPKSMANRLHQLFKEYVITIELHCFAISNANV